MNRLRVVLLTVAAVVTAASIASAQSLNLNLAGIDFKAPAAASARAAKAPAAEKTAEAPAPAFTWTGFYVGGGGGFGVSTPFWDSLESGAIYNGCCLFDLDSSGGINYFGQVGINRMVHQNILVGGAFLFGKAGYHGEGFDGPGDDTRQSFEGGMMWALRGRAGYAFRRSLVYFNLGMIGVTTEGRVLDDCTASPCGPGLVDASASEMADKFTWGIGYEFALGQQMMGRRWSIGVEWNRQDFRTVIDVPGTWTSGSATGTSNWRLNPHFPQATLTVALNLHWGDEK